MATKEINIDDEVWGELQKLARPFEDTPNSVLRRLLRLDTDIGKSSNSIEKEETMDDRVDKFLNEVTNICGYRPVTRTTKSNSFGILHKERKKRIGYLYPQKKRRLKIETKKEWAEKMGATNWDHSKERDWWSVDASVYWYLDDGDDEKYREVAGIIAKLIDLDI